MKKNNRIRAECKTKSLTVIEYDGVPRSGRILFFQRWIEPAVDVVLFSRNVHLLSDDAELNKSSQIKIDFIERYLGEIGDTVESETFEEDLAEFGQSLIRGEVEGRVVLIRLRRRRLRGCCQVRRAACGEEQDGAQGSDEVSHSINVLNAAVLDDNDEVAKVADLQIK